MGDIPGWVTGFGPWVAVIFAAGFNYQRLTSLERTVKNGLTAKIETLETGQARIEARCVERGQTLQDLKRATGVTR